MQTNRASAGPGRLVQIRFTLTAENPRGTQRLPTTRRDGRRTRTRARARRDRVKAVPRCVVYDEVTTTELAGGTAWPIDRTSAGALALVCGSN
jgi:hypothetical protein